MATTTKKANDVMISCESFYCRDRKAKRKTGEAR